MANPGESMGVCWRLMVTGLALAGTAFVMAIVLAVIDLYVTGHASASLMQPWTSWRGVVAMSRADVVLGVASLANAAAVFMISGQSGRRPAV